MKAAIKKFDVQEETIPGGYYRIVVKFRGVVVDTFIESTMALAIAQFERAGYTWTY